MFTPPNFSVKANFIRLSTWLAIIPNPAGNENIPLNHKDPCGVQGPLREEEKKEEILD
jgi:hypothetical protein